MKPHPSGPCNPQGIHVLDLTCVETFGFKGPSYERELLVPKNANDCSLDNIAISHLS